VADLPYRKASGPLTFVLLIGGLLAALLFTKPNWDAARGRSRTAECGINLELVADRESALADAGRGYLGCPAFPKGQPVEAMAWESAPACWTELGFRPDVLLWGRYSVEATASGWHAVCTIDADNDGDVAKWTASDETTASADPNFED